MILNEATLENIITVQHRNQEVSDIKFSPGRYSKMNSNGNMFLSL
jgi:hypothetical protein